MTGMGEHNMKNGKLSGLRLTPLAVVIVVGMVVLGTELLFMLTLHELLIPLAPFELPDIAWDFIDAITLTAVVTPLFYFLVFRSMENEERFRQTLATAPNAIVIVDEQGRITDWNLAAQRMFGYSREEAVGQTMHQLIAPHRFHDDAVRGFAHFEESGSGPLIGKTTEVAALRKDGSEFPVEVSISALKLKGHWHAVGIIHDITERKQAEELVSAQLAEIKRARLDWQAVFDSISHPIFLHDGEFRVIRANRAYAEQAGKSFQEIIGQPYYEAFPKSDKPMPCCLRAMEKAEEEEEEVAVGAAIYRSRSFAVRNEQGAYLYSVHILEDITERRRTANALRDSETRLHTVVENLTEGLAVSDLDGQLLHFNRAALDLHGFATLDECRQHLSKFADTFEISALDGTVLPLDQWPLARVLRGENLHDLEVYVRHLQAGWKRIYSYGGTLVRDNGQPLLAILTISDITERKQTEAKLREMLKEANQSRLVMLDMVEDQRRADESLRQLNVELESKVLARTADLNQARIEAEQANRAKSEFLATMSHEIRTPMNGVIGMVDVLQQSSLKGPQMEMVNIIHDSAFSLLTVVNDILDFSKIEAGKLEIENVPISVADVVEE